LYDILVESLDMKTKTPKKAAMSPKSKPGWAYRIAVEMGFIIFLFYSNLLMGEFLHSNSDQGKSLAYALMDIFTLENFTVALATSLAGYLMFEFLRKKL
jgi:hypothetical protein